MFLINLKERYGNKIELIGEYRGSGIKTDFVNTNTWNIFEATPHTVLSGSTLGLGGRSRGELEIKEWLNKKQVNYVTEFTFNELRSKKGKMFRFDFAIFSDSHQLSPEYLIEFDGEQHYKPVEHWGGQQQFEKQQLYDRIKTEFCNQQGIPLIRIPYWDIDRIEEILTEELVPLLNQKVS